MDVTAHFDHPRLLKEHRWSLLAFIEGDLKTLGAREGIDVVVDLVVVGKVHFCAHHNRQEGRDKLLVHLIHNGCARARRERLPRRRGLHKNDRLGDSLSILSYHAAPDLGSRGGGNEERGCNQSNEEQKSNALCALHCCCALPSVAEAVAQLPAIV